MDRIDASSLDTFKPFAQAIFILYRRPLIFETVSLFAVAKQLYVAHKVGSDSIPIRVETPSDPDLSES
jgi:hypothetical protein